MTHRLVLPSRQHPWEETTHPKPTTSCPTPILFAEMEDDEEFITALNSRVYEDMGFLDEPASDEVVVQEPRTNSDGSYASE